jgi:hypothetical protein
MRRGRAATAVVGAVISIIARVAVATATCRSVCLGTSVSSDPQRDVLRRPRVFRDAIGRSRGPERARPRSSAARYRHRVKPDPEVQIGCLAGRNNRKLL